MILPRALNLLILFSLLLILGCHSTPLKPPPSANGPDRETQWLKDYKAARDAQSDDAEKACGLFTHLADDAQFPARDVARLRALETCDTDHAPKYDRAQTPAYLQEIAGDVLLKLAQDRKDKAAEIDLAVEKSKRRLPQNEKLQWMNLALQRAEELKLEDRLPELQKRIYTIAPRLNPNPEEKDYLSCANDLRLARVFAKSRDFYGKVIHSSAFDVDSKIAAYKGIRLSFKNARQNDQHLKSAQSLIDYVRIQLKANPRSRSLLTAYYDARVYLARALWTLGRTSDAQKVFAALEKRMKGKISLAELYWLRGRIADDAKDLDSVARYMDLAQRERFNDPELRDKILWYSAWNERRRGNLPRAVEILKDLDDKTQTDFTRARALYWLGRTYADNKQPEESQKILQRLIDVDPLGYYGLLAHRQLGVPIQLQTLTRDIASPPQTPQLPLDTRLADWLGALEENDALTALLDQTSQIYKKQKQQTDEGWVQIFKYYARAGLYMKLYESLGSLPPDRRKTIFERHPDLLFPQPWAKDTTEAAKQFGIEPELIYAIIRQESAFDPHARSLADAFGVMQLLPEVAESLSHKYKIPYSTMEDLYDPKTNIYLGAAHLKELFNRHKGQFILAVAAYNASDEVIRNWMKNRFRGDAMEFIEDIPYEETRAYVRLVMRNLIFYDLLKSKNASIDFPSWVLKLES